MSIGQSIEKDPEIANLLQQLVKRIGDLNQQGGNVADANPEKKAEYQEMLDHFAAVRGRPLFYPYIGSGSGTGPYVEMADGSRKIDLINGIGVHLFGHGHPLVIEASIKGAMQDIVMQGHLEMNSVYLSYSQKIIDLAKPGSRLKHGWISPSGSMANENALKMARQKNSPARKILAMKNAFSGRTTMMAEITDNPKYKVGLPDYGEVLRVPFYDKDNPNSIEESLQALKKHIAENPGDISCFCFEPVLGEGGYRVAPPEFFTPLLEECRKNNIAVWADEVQTFLRTGEPFAFQTLGFGEYVDLVSVAKTGQAGFTLYTDEYNPKPGLVAGTFASSSSALFAGLAMMTEMETKGYFGSAGKIASIHNKMIAGLTQLCEGSCRGLLEDPEGLGLMVAVTPFGGDRPKVMELLKVLFDNGMVAFGCGKDPFRLRFLLPAIMGDNDIETACSLLEKSILQLK